MASRRKFGNEAGGDGPPLRAAERLLVEALDELPGTNVLCVLSPECAVPLALADRRESAAICCHFLDAGAAEFARSTHLAGLEGVEAIVESDVPRRPFDLALVPFPSGNEIELGRELLEQAADGVRDGGMLAAACDLASDAHLKVEMKKLFARATRRPSREGVLYIAGKTAPVTKRRDFSAGFAFRDRGRLIRGVSRPGLRSHRRLEAGVRPLLAALEISPGERVLNLGCDAGAIALAAAARDAGATIVAVDSSCRAVDCTRRGAELNGLTNLEARLAPGRWAEPPGSFDLVIALPPYISNERIADIYIDGAVQALRPGGRVLLSTKRRVWFLDELSRAFRDLDDTEARDHSILRGIRR